ncbi:MULTISPECIES: hypothetical protein [unclassified Granulicatella]|uniref:hypothetical protein n=1 Tax=unclassified Granulicatella TaxID=2630493 RepID=UPI001073B180|nr:MULTISPECIES: hypothetical protein [unclassified Granulicatella]MBF0779873.1 hypothetical protein [Granulicatella sp. 19428wC4_WM01]TFU96077.1 hypothetical protein E4T68_02075 [Granulicatella sp. WM01]
MKIDFLETADNPFGLTFTFWQNNHQLQRCKAKEIPVVIRSIDYEQPVTLIIAPVKIIQWCYPLLLLVSFLFEDILEPFIIQQLTFMPQNTIQVDYQISSSRRVSLSNIPVLADVCYIRKFEFVLWGIVIGMINLLMIFASFTLLFSQLWYVGLFLSVLTSAVLYVFIKKGRQLYQYTQRA